MIMSQSLWQFIFKSALILGSVIHGTVHTVSGFFWPQVKWRLVWLYWKEGRQNWASHTETILMDCCSRSKKREYIYINIWINCPFKRKVLPEFDFLLCSILAGLVMLSKQAGFRNISYVLLYITQLLSVTWSNNKHTWMWFSAILS